MVNRDDLEMDDLAYVDFILQQLKEDCSTEMLERLHFLLEVEIQERDGRNSLDDNFGNR